MPDHVLVPLDGSDHSEQALEYALQEFPDAEISVLHVLNPVGAMAYSDVDYVDVDGYQQQLKHQRERGERILAAARETAAGHGREVETLLESGQPARTILATVEDEGVDHIVMGSHGRSGVGRILFGSVAETVTRRSPVPVTICR